MYQKDADVMTNSVDPDQTAPGAGAVLSGSTLSAQIGLSEIFNTFWYC